MDQGATSAVSGMCYRRGGVLLQSLLALQPVPELREPITHVRMQLARVIRRQGQHANQLLHVGQVSRSRPGLVMPDASFNSINTGRDT